MDCNGCTICCKVLDIPWMDSPVGFYCKECEPGVGCRIWEDRPEECKTFKCSYYKVKNCNKNLRPDKCGVVFEKATKNIFFGTLNEDAVVLDKFVNIQITKFLEKGFSIILKHPKLKEPYILTAEGKFANDIWEEAKKAWSLRTMIQI